MNEDTKEAMQRRIELEKCLKLMTHDELVALVMDIDHDVVAMLETAIKYVTPLREEALNNAGQR